MRIELLDPAKRELVQAVTYYNGECEGLGFRFVVEVKRTLSRIVQHPYAWPAISPRARRCRTNGIPYGIIYEAREDLILVVAVMYLHRHPDSWKSRLPSE